AIELSLCEEISRQEVEPHRLAVRAQRLHRIHAAFHFETCAFAAFTTFCAVKPKCCIKSLAGAEAPKPWLPMTAPPDLTQRSHPIVAAASTDTRALIAAGNTISR